MLPPVEPPVFPVEPLVWCVVVVPVPVEPPVLPVAAVCAAAVEDAAEETVEDADEEATLDADEELSELELSEEDASLDDTRADLLFVVEMPAPDALPLRIASVTIAATSTQAETDVIALPFAVDSNALTFSTAFPTVSLMLSLSNMSLMFFMFLASHALIVNPWNTIYDRTFKKNFKGFQAKK